MRARVGPLVFLALGCSSEPDSAAGDASPPVPDSGDLDAASDVAEADTQPVDACTGWKVVQGSAQAILTDPNDVYRYAPTQLNLNGVEHVWMCGNVVPGDVHDHVLYSQRTGGVMSAPVAVLGAGDPGAWDSFHVCDPNVISGSFALSGETYGFALFYSGNDVNSTDHVQLGVAFSKTLAGGGQWVRLPKPLVSHPPGQGWGVGQPTAVSLDGAGKVLLAYTRATTAPHVFVREVDLANAEAPALGPEVQLSEQGITGSTGAADVLTNVDVLLAPATQKLYLLTERHPFPNDEPKGLTASLQLVSMNSSDAVAGVGQWESVALIDESVTGRPRNHNGGFVRTERGELPAAGELRLLFSDSCGGCAFPSWLFTVRPWELRLEACN